MAKKKESHLQHETKSEMERFLARKINHFWRGCWNINILWDFDGTLFDTYPSFVQAFIQLTDKELDKEEVLKWLKVDSKKAFEHFGIEEEKRGTYKALYNEAAKTISKPFPYIERVLASSTKNFIVTHRDRESTLYLLDKYQLSSYFDEVISVEEDGFLRKPHSSSYEYVSQKYKVDLVIGDRALDLLPAKELGIKTVSFQNTELSADYHIDCYADFLVIFLAEYFGIHIDKTKQQDVTPSFVRNYFEEADNRLKHILQVASRMNNSVDALLHDIGYSTDLNRTNFHPLDGALFAIELHCSPRDIKSILFHSKAEGEAHLRGGELALLYQIATSFLTDADKQAIDHLTYYDMTTSSVGEIIPLEERIQDILARYTTDSVVYQNIVASRRYFNQLKNQFN